MYKDGQMPIEVFYEYFLAANVIPEYVTLEMFKGMLEDEGQFPNNPDYKARKDGFPSAQQQRQDELQRDLADIEDENHGDELQSEADLLDTELEHSEQEAEKARKAAKDNPGLVPPVPGQARDALNKDKQQGGSPAPAGGTPPKKPKLSVPPKAGK
jgi:hypothetical protein